MAYLTGYKSCCNDCGGGLSGLGTSYAGTAVGATIFPGDPNYPIPQSQRLLDTGEILDFLSRHPIIAARVALTRAALRDIGYEQINTPPAWYEYDINIGLLPHSGIEVQDSKYGRVVIFPAPNGTIYFNGFVGGSGPAPGQINLPPFQSPTTPPGTEECGFLCTAEKYKNGALLVIGGLIALEVIRTAARK